MLRIFKPKKKQNRNTRGKDYYHRENLIQTRDELSKILELLDSPNIINTSNNLVFHNKELTAITVNDLETDYGKESYILDPESGINGHEIYYYRIISGTFRFLLQLHFIDNKFFFAGTKIATENEMLQSDKKIIIDSVKKRYCIDEDCKDETFKIKDPQGNILTSHDNIFYYIKYLVNNEISRKLQSQYSQHGGNGLGEDLDSTLDGLI